MSDEEAFIERRKHERFEVKSGAVVGVPNTKSGYACLGRFINISKGGLAFRYDDKKVESTGVVKVDILSAQDSFYLYDIPVETVWISDAGIDPTSSRLTTKAIGVKFKELSPKQQVGLDVFIQKYTTRECQN